MYKNLNLSTLGIAGSQSELIELALTYGFRAMDFDIVDFASRSRIHGLAYARRLIDSSKMRITSFALPLDWNGDDDDFQKDLKGLSHYGELAGEIGCTRCLALVAPGSDTRPYHENFEFHRRRLTEICRALAPMGIRLGVGCRAAADLRAAAAFQFIHEPDALGMLVNMVDADNIGLLVDAWDWVVSGRSLETLQNTPVERMVAVHLADMPEGVAAEGMSETYRLLPGTSGRIPSETVLATLAERGYDGPVTAKPHKGIFKGVRRDAIVKRTADALDQVWKAAGLSSRGSHAARTRS